jgi:hypothetical protein
MKREKWKVISEESGVRPKEPQSRKKKILKFLLTPSPFLDLYFLLLTSLIVS